MSYEYAKLGSTCNTSMRVLLSNTKFIHMNDPIYKDSQKLLKPLKVEDKTPSKAVSITKQVQLEEVLQPVENVAKPKIVLNKNPQLNPM
jgi:hypothetical protein